jgi:hypothetical protein
MIKKIFVSVLLLSAMVLPTFAFATSSTSATNSYANYTEDQLVTLIAKLQKQLEEVRKNSVPCSLATVDLSLGDGEGDTLKEHVKNLQSFLKEKGHFTYTATGYFGKLTKAALMSFQKSQGLAQTGEFTSAVREKIKNLKCKMNYYYNKPEVSENNDNNGNNSGEVSSIVLSGTGSAVSWVTTGYSDNGFKVVWSKNSNPTYPTRDGDKYIYLSSASAVSSSLDAFDGSGTYYVRVCEYLGGVCGKYSNQITVSL